jgi:AcrR family transcriptional regulator
MSPDRRKGRHQIVGDAEILDAALSAFAATGYDAMSVRHLNAQLGLSHETVRQRFGSKLELYFSAVDFGVARFSLLAEERARLPVASSDLEELRALTHSFITASMRRPELANLVNHDATTTNERLDYIFRVGFAPGTEIFADLFHRLIAQGVIHEVTVREYFFLIDAGMSPFAQGGLSRAFDPISGPLNEDAHVERFVDFVFRGLTRSSTH